jgi:hypothetical protein
MNTHADKTQENKSQSVANEVSQKQSGSESFFQFVDNRPEAIEQRKLQEMANNSPRAKQLKAFQKNEVPNGQETIHRKVSPLQRKENLSSSRGVVQRITHNGVAIDIATLGLADSRNHLSRLRRIRGITAAGGVVLPVDAQYNYDPADEATLQARIQVLEAAELEARRVAVRDGLIAQLAALATAADWTNAPAWAGTNLAAVNGGEVIGANLLPAGVAARWVAFLGPGALSHRHPRTGAVDATRLVSADGQRSIRYGAHEQNSAANQHHFHEETWTHNVGPPQTVMVANVLRRAPVT